MQLISIKEVCQRLCIGRTTLWTMTKEDGFPKLVKITNGRKAFVKSEIDAWIEALIAKRDGVAS